MPCWHWHITDISVYHHTEFCFYYWALALTLLCRDLRKSTEKNRKMLEAVCGVVGCLLSRQQYNTSCKYKLYMICVYFIIYIYTYTQCGPVLQRKTVSVPQCPDQCQPLTGDGDHTHYSCWKPWKFFQGNSDCWALLTVRCSQEMRCWNRLGASWCCLVQLSSRLKFTFILQSLSCILQWFFKVL